MKRTNLVIIPLLIALTGCTSLAAAPDITAETAGTVTVLETAAGLADAQTAAVKDSSREFVDQVWEVFADSVCEYELITDIRIDNKNLIIDVSLPVAADTEDLTVEEITVNSTGSIADPILDMTEYYDLWDSITVDFGSLGYSTNTKDNITGESFPYFKNITIHSK